MFGLRKRQNEPLGNARRAGRWLASLPTNDPLLVQREVAGTLDRLAQRSARRTPAALKAVFFVDAWTKAVVGTLLAQYVEHATRSPKVEDQLWHALFNLAQSFHACYAAFVRESADHPHARKWQLLQHELVARQIVQLGLEARIRLYRCERWESTRWAELHALFSRACALHVERRPIVLDASARSTTVEHQYLVILVLQLADPGNLAPKHIDWVASRLDGWCEPLRFTVAPRYPTTFYVDLAGTTGLLRRALRPLEGRVLFVDTRPLLAVLLQRRSALEQAVRSDPLSDRNPKSREELQLFVKLVNRIDPEFKPLARRGERTPASGAVEAIVGFGNISGFLREGIESPQTTPPELAGRTFKTAMEYAVFGRSRDAPERRPHYTLLRLNPYAAPGGPWELKDTSASGYRLHAPMSVATEITLSMLVAVSRRGREAWVLGIVRRMRRLSANLAEVGLELIADELVDAELVEQRKGRGVEYAAGAGSATAGGRRFAGLVLSYARPAGGPPVQSLIVPAVNYEPSKRYLLRTASTTRPIRFGRILEQQTEWVWTVVEQPDADAGGADATDSA